MFKGPCCLAMEHTRALSLSRRVLTIVQPCLLPSVEMKPRTECFCQAVAATISSKVAPPARFRRSRIIAFLPSSRVGRAAFLAVAATSMDISHRASARHRDVTLTAIRKAIARKLIKLESDGSLSPRGPAALGGQ